MRREPPAPDIHNTLTQKIEQLSKTEEHSDALSRQRNLEKIIEQLREENR